jgi:hypothetical protein
MIWNAKNPNKFIKCISCNTTCKKKQIDDKNKHSIVGKELQLLRKSRNPRMEKNPYTILGTARRGIEKLIGDY